jgi:hypothetical protein
VACVSKDLHLHTGYFCHHILAAIHEMAVESKSTQLAISRLSSINRRARRSITLGHGVPDDDRVGVSRDDDATYQPRPELSFDVAWSRLEGRHGGTVDLQSKLCDRLLNSKVVGIVRLSVCQRERNGMRWYTGQACRIAMPCSDWLDGTPRAPTARSRYSRQEACFQGDGNGIPRSLWGFPPGKASAIGPCLTILFTDIQRGMMIGHQENARLGLEATPSYRLPSQRGLFISA